MDDFVRQKLTEWGLSDWIERFKGEGIDKETFLNLGDLERFNVLIPKIGPRVKFRKRLKEYLQWNSMETCDFVRDKLTEWDLCELIQTFEDEGIDKETFLSLEESGRINILIPKIGPRAKFRKRLGKYLQTQRRRHADIPEMDIDTNSEKEDSPEVEPPIFPWLFPSDYTSTSDIDSGSETIEEPIYPGATVTRGQGMLAVILFILHHSLTAAGQSDLMALLNFLIPNLDLALKYLSDKVPGVSIVFYCQACQNYMGKNPDDGSCCHCHAEFSKTSSMKSGHFFLSASLKDLLKDILKNHNTELLPKTVNNGHDIKDIMDGRMYQNLLRQGTLAADDLTLSWNSDGVPVFNSASYSIWPLQFTVNELPYMQRKENVLVAGLWFGEKKPNMNTFLKPFVDECCDLASNPFQWRDSSGSVHSSKVFSLVCSSDAVARPLLRNCTQFNGEYGCDWCLHPGTMVKKGNGYMRCYAHDEQKQIPRSNEMFRDNAVQAENSPTYGVKGLSSLCMLPLFDIVFGFVPEYMHSVLLGVSKQLMSLWLDPINSVKPWYVGCQISEMDSRLLQLKPPSEITRPPQSLKCWKKWKAWEWRAFLLLYAISVLPGIIDPVFLEHYFYLSFSIHILLQESLSQHDLELARDYLVRFVKDMEVHYGKENVSFNCHQLIHLAESVQNWGPLWATSAFSFERNNGELRALLGDKNYNSQHIYQKFLVWQHIPRHFSSSVFNRHSDFNELLAQLSPVNDGSVPNRPFGTSRHLDLTESMKQVMEELLNQPVLVQSVEAFDSFINGNTVYHSNKCETGKTNCVIKLNNGHCGEIQMILLYKENCVCTSNCSCQAIPIIVVQLYNIQPNKMFLNEDLHRTFTRVERTNQRKAFLLRNIRCKCMYVDGWLVPLPNTCERY